MALISSGAASIAPVLILGWENAADTPGAVVELLSGNQAIILRAATPAAFPLRLFFDMEATAQAAFAALKIARTWTISGADRAQQNIQFVVTGGLTITLDPQTASHWIVQADVMQVSA